MRYEILLRIGNLGGASFTSMKVGLDYGLPFPQAQGGQSVLQDQLRAYRDSRKHKDFTLTTQVLADRWSFVKLDVALWNLKRYGK